MEGYMRRIALSSLVFSLLLSGVCLYSQTNAAVERSLETKERAGWQAWKDHNPRLIEGVTPNDAIDIADGIAVRGKQQVVEATAGPGCSVRSFSLSDFSFMWLDRDTVLITYTATQDATCNGKKQSGKVTASSIWQKRNGKWMSPFHQETAVAGT
jgi:hypothetical protein